jgi:tRNA(Ile)-lysidine synthase
MKNLVKQVQNVNSRHLLWTEGDILILGVSGGPDSMCLFDIMCQIAKKRELTIIVAHINYGLRGDNSDDDQKKVEEYSKSQNIICETYIYTGKDSDENTLRIVRYDFFAQLFKKYNASGILVAHTKNDQAETLLLHLLRGSGLQGLSGMKVKTQNNIIRPLLYVQRTDILKYCADNNIDYNIDKSNDEVFYVRNKVRNNLIPYLEKEFNPQIIDVLAKTTQTVAEDYDFLEKQNKTFWKYNSEDKKIIFSAKYFSKQHTSVQRYSLRTMILQISGNIMNIESGFVEELQKVLLSGKNKHQEITGKNLKMLRKGDIVELTCLSKNK